MLSPSIKDVLGFVTLTIATIAAISVYRTTVPKRSEVTRRAPIEDSNLAQTRSRHELITPAVKYEPPPPPDITLILLWTPLDGFSGNWVRHFGPGYNAYLETCNDIESKRLVVTDDRERISESSLVLFNLNDLGLLEHDDFGVWVDSKLPPDETRTADQRWALFWREPPTKATLPEEKMHWLDGLFNWTISYRRDADVFYPFGIFRDIPRKTVLNQAWNELGNRTGIAWFSNVCETPSKREELAKTLKEYDKRFFTTDLYGKCADREITLKNDEQLFSQLSASVRFFLVAEQEICDDYITEDFYRALAYSFVPVVVGGRDVGFDEVALAGTYIDALDFDTEQDLASYLGVYLRDNAEEFLQYLTWQYEFRVVPSIPSWVCEIGLALAGAPVVGHLDDDQDYFYPAGNEEDRGGHKAITDFRRFWQRKKCYGSYLDALRTLTQ